MGMANRLHRAQLATTRRVMLTTIVTNIQLTTEGDSSNATSREDWVGIASELEYGPHVGHLTGIPNINILVEAAHRTEHVPYVGHLAGVFAAQRMIKRREISENKL